MNVPTYGLRCLIALTISCSAVVQTSATVLNQPQTLQDPAHSEAVPAPLQPDELFGPDELSRLIRIVADLPELFREAAVATGCRMEGIRDFPAELIRVQQRSQRSRRDRVFAILPCGGSRGANWKSLYVLERSGTKVALVTLPVLDPEGRIVSSRIPGWLEWQGEVRQFRATVGTDLTPHTMFRHHYVLNGTDEPVVALTLVESRRFDTGGKDGVEWKPVWKAPDWGMVNDPKPVRDQPWP